MSDEVLCGNYTDPVVSAIQMKHSWTYGLCFLYKTWPQVPIRTSNAGTLITVE